jgi:hypothetical protein
LSWIWRDFLVELEQCYLLSGDHAYRKPRVPTNVGIAFLWPLAQLLSPTDLDFSVTFVPFNGRSQ